MHWHIERFTNRKETSSSGAIRTQVSAEPTIQQTEYLHTNGLSHQGSSLNMISIARPYDELAFSQLDITADWLTWIYTFIHSYIYTHAYGCLRSAQKPYAMFKQKTWLYRVDALEVWITKEAWRPKKLRCKWNTPWNTPEHTHKEDVNPVKNIWEND